MATSSIPKTSGIYKITCTANGKIYVGSSVNLHKRWNEHRKALRNNYHHNKHLQRAWDRYGQDTFVFEILELVNSGETIERENYWLDMLKPYDHNIGFNIGCKADSGMKGRKHSPETRMKFSIAFKGRKASPETKAKLSALRRGKKMPREVVERVAAANRGKKRSPEIVEKNRLVHLGRKQTPEEKAKQIAAQIGHVVSDETRKKISIANRGKERSPEMRVRISEATCHNTYVVTSPDGLEYIVRNLNQFCKENHLDQGHMSKVSLGKYPAHKGWKVKRI